MTLEKPKTAAHREALWEYEPRKLTIVRPLEREIWALLNLLTIRDVCVDLCSLRHPESKLSQLEEVASRVAACIKQASEYAWIAQGCSTRVAPLLHYYSMLNTSKAFIYMQSPRVLEDARNLNHGLVDAHRVKDPRVFSLPKDSVKVDHGIFSSLCMELTQSPVPRGLSLQLCDLLRGCNWIVAEVDQVYGAEPSTASITSSVVTNQERTETWGSVLMSRGQLDSLGMSLDQLRKRVPDFFNAYVQVEGGPKSYRFETGAYPTNTDKEREEALTRLRSYLRTLNLYRPMKREGSGGWALYRMSTHTIPQPAAIYAIAFYLSSLVRYQPHALEALLASADAWVIESFLTQCPLEFSYTMLNHMWRREHIFEFAA